MTFDKAVAFVLEIEGGIVDDPADPGRITKWGISSRSYPGLDIANLTREAAIAIYKRDFWDKLSCDQLPHGLDLLLFDSAVNQGPATAVRILQTVLHSTKVDGIMGPITIEAARNRPDVVIEYLGQRMYQYALIPQILTFGRGWYRRLAKAAQVAFTERTAILP